MTKPDSGPSSRGFHRLALYAACPQKFAYAQLLRIEPMRLSEPLALGTLGHLALMHHYLAMTGQPAENPIEAMRAAPARIVWCFERAKAAVEAYLIWASVNDRAWTVLDVEREFQIQVRGELYTQRADLVVQGADKKVYFVDHKFIGGAVDKLPRWRLFDGQNFGYDLIGRTLIGDAVYKGMQYGGVILNLIGTAPPYRSKRHPALLSERLRKEWIFTLDAQIGACADLERRFASDPTMAWHAEKRGIVNGLCQGRYDACEFMSLCQHGEPELGGFRCS